MKLNDVKDIAKALTIECYRNSYIEDLHSNIKELNDEEMKKLNKDICNRVYSILLLFFANSDKGYDILADITAFNKIYGAHWDDPELDLSLFKPEDIEIIKQIEQNF